MITRFFLIVFFMAPVPLFAGTLTGGSVYFDSIATLNEVIRLSGQHDNDGIAKLIETGHIATLTGADMDIVVLSSGPEPESPAEFRFLKGPTTYWTPTKNVTDFAKPLALTTPAPTPAAEPLPTPIPAPVAAPSPTPTPKAYYRERKSDDPSDDDHGRRVWHQVNGKWKWYPATGHHVRVKRALPASEAPAVQP